MFWPIQASNFFKPQLNPILFENCLKDTACGFLASQKQQQKKQQQKKNQEHIGLYLEICSWNHYKYIIKKYVTDIAVSIETQMPVKK